MICSLSTRLGQILRNGGRQVESAILISSLFPEKIVRISPDALDRDRILSICGKNWLRESILKKRDNCKSLQIYAASNKVDCFLLNLHNNISTVYRKLHHDAVCSNHTAFGFHHNLGGRHCQIQVECKKASGTHGGHNPH